MSLLHGEVIVKDVVYEGSDNPNGAAVIHVVVDDKIVWHRYTSVVIPPSCTERGYDLHTCTCGDSYKDNYTNATGHAYESVLQAPTCTEDGYTTHTCTYCGDSYKVTTENALGHDYGDWTITSEPTCVVEGSKRRDCRRVMCDAYETATIPAPGHASSDWIIDIEPTTVSEGSKHKECTVCGKVLETETINQLAPLTFTYIDGSVKDGYSVSATDTSVSGDITIPSEEDYVEVISIEDYAFRNCANLTSVVIPKSVTSIGKDAFYNCDKLTHIYYCGTEAEWDSVTIGFNDEYSRLALSGKLYFLCDEHPIYAPSSDDDVSTYGFRGYWHYVDGVPTAWCYELAYLEEVAPTCDMPGLTDGYYCTICGTVLVEQEEVAATGHDWTSIVIKPTCTEQGYTQHYCNNTIRHNYRDNYTDALGHTWAEATCDKPRTCSVCGYTEGSATGHSWNAPTYTWADDYSTCTAIRVCSNNSSHTETATATITSKVTTAATCTTAGVRTYTATFSESWAATQTTTATIDATGHSWSKTTYTWDGTSSCTASRYCLNDTSHTEIREGTVGYAVTKAASCTDTGIGTYTAKFTASVGGSDWALEDQTKTVTIAATGHKYSRVVTPPTCTAKGYTTYTCSVCNHVYTDNEVAATGHNFTLATCTEPKTCTKCGLTEGQAIGHTWVAATCTKPKTCSVCGETEGSTLGHTWGAKTTYTWASDYSTCTARRTCTKDLSHTETLNGRVSSSVTKAATCTATGTRTYTATFTASADSDWSLTKQTKTVTIAATGHTASDWIIDTAATATAEGSKHKECTVCGKVLETATIPKLEAETLHEPEITDAVLSSGGTSGEMWIYNPNPISVTCCVSIYDNTGAEVASFDVTIQPYTNEYVEMQFESSFERPYECYSYFEPDEDGYECSEEVSVSLE